MGVDDRRNTLTCEYPDAIMYITGDFNRLNVSQALTDTGLSQMVIDCTRGRHTLDLFITNRPHLVTCKAVQSCISTDHCALLTNSDKYQQSANIPRRTVDFYDIRQQHLSNLADFLHRHDWSSILHTTDINVAYDTFLYAVSPLRPLHLLTSHHSSSLSLGNATN